jgi:RNA polymerase sigma-70 factor (ECF subfamily)
MQSDIVKYVKSLKNGDVKAFRSIFDLYQSTVYGVAKKMTGDIHYSEEITSQVFVTLWKKRETLNPEYPILSLIIKITKDLVANHYNKILREKFNLDKYLSETSANYQFADDTSIIFQLYLDIAENAIQQLPEKRREIFKLYFYQNISYSEIAQQLEIEESTARVHVFKALEFLRNHILTHPDFGP